MAARKTRKSENLQTVSVGSTVRFEQPKSKRHKTTTVELIQEINPGHGFVKFLREQAVVGLAVGFIIGTQAQVLVKQLVSSFINPLFTLFFGQNLANRTFSVTFHDRTADFAWGAFVYGLVNFLFVIFAIYLFIKFFKLDKLDKPKKKKD